MLPCQFDVQKADLLSRFILLGEDPELNFTDKTLRDIILNFIIAGEKACKPSYNRHSASSYSLGFQYSKLISNPQSEKCK